MYQARISRLAPHADGVTVTVQLAGQGRHNTSQYVLEIVTEPMESLSVPNEAIIETGGKRVVYIQQQPGQYAQREIQTGLQGELFTEVLDGLTAGDQVVTFGSFFIDADHRLKGGS
jgi:multidrug efflux pump subunit AcrA (membrane-fusion protein)